DRVQVGDRDRSRPASGQTQDRGAASRRALRRAEADQAHRFIRSIRRFVSLTETPRSTRARPSRLSPAASTIAAAVRGGTSRVAAAVSLSPPPRTPPPPDSSGGRSTSARASGTPSVPLSLSRTTRTRSPESRPSGTRPLTSGTPTSATVQSQNEL